MRNRPSPNWLNINCACCSYREQMQSWQSLDCLKKLQNAILRHLQWTVAQFGRGFENSIQLQFDFPRPPRVIWILMLHWCIARAFVFLQSEGGTYISLYCVKTVAFSFPEAPKWNLNIDALLHNWACIRFLQLENWRGRAFEFWSGTKTKDWFDDHDCNWMFECLMTKCYYCCHTATANFIQFPQ